MEKSKSKTNAYLSKRYCICKGIFLMQLLYSHVMCVSAQKNTHYLLVFDSLVIIVCLTSAVLCARSIILALRLLQVTCSVTHYHLFLFFTATFLFFFFSFFFIFRLQVFCPCLSFLDWLGKCLLPIYTNIIFFYGFVLLCRNRNFAPSYNSQI